MRSKPLIAAPVRTPQREPLCDMLEARQLMAQTSSFTDVDGDIFSIVLDGPGTFVATPGNVANANAGLRTLALSGTTAASSLFVTRTTSVGNGVLNINLVTGGTLDRLHLDTAFTQLIPEATIAGIHGIKLSDHARSIRAGNVTNAAISQGGTTSKNRSSVLVLSLTNGNIDSGGVIESVSTLNWVGGSVSAVRIGTIFVSNNGAGVPAADANFSISTEGEGLTYGVRQITVAGRIGGGSWTMSSPVQRIEVGNVLLPVPALVARANDGPREASEFQIRVNGRIGQLTSLANLSGSFTADSFGYLGATGLLVARVRTSVGVAASNTANSIDTLRARLINNLDLNVVNGISLLYAGAIESSRQAGTAAISAGWIDSLDVVGDRTLLGNDIFNTDIQLNNTARTSSLKKLSVVGSLVGSTIGVLNSIGNVQIGGMRDSVLTAGRAARGLTSIPTNTSGFTAANGTITTLRIGALPGAPTNFERSIVAARTLGGGLLDLNVNTVAANNFGFAFDAIDSLLYRPAGGVQSGYNSYTATNLTLKNTGQFFISVL